MHQQHYTLSLLNDAITQSPNTIAESRKQEMYAELKKLEQDQSVTKEIIEQKIQEYGKVLWPHIQAFKEIYNKDSQPKENKEIEKRLDDATKTKWNEFISTGGDLEDVKNPKKLGNTFEGDQMTQLDKAVVEARQHLEDSLSAELLNQRSEEYTQLVEKYISEQNEIYKAVDQLNELANQPNAPKAEIDEKIKMIKDSFAFLEKPISTNEAEKTVEYFKGRMGLME